MRLDAAVLAVAQRVVDAPLHVERAEPVVEALKDVHDLPPSSSSAGRALAGVTRHAPFAATTHGLSAQASSRASGTALSGSAVRRTTGSTGALAAPSGHG